MLVSSIFSFSHNVFKRIIFQGHLKLGLDSKRVMMLSFCFRRCLKHYSWKNLGVWPKITSKKYGHKQRCVHACIYPVALFLFHSWTFHFDWTVCCFCLQACDGLPKLYARLQCMENCKGLESRCLQRSHFVVIFICDAYISDAFFIKLLRVCSFFDCNCYDSRMWKVWIFRQLYI